MSQNNIFVNGPKRDFPHLLHLVLTILTCGLWLPIWILAYIFS